MKGLELTFRKLRSVRSGFIFALLAFWLAPIMNDAAWARAFADPLSAAAICANHDGQSGGAHDPAAPAAPHDCCQVCAFAASAAATPAQVFSFTAVDRRAEAAAWAAPVQKSVFPRWPGNSEARGPPDDATP